MEKETRVNKYKELRDEMKEEVAIDRHVVVAQDDKDDDFLAFLPREEKVNVDDTLIEPLTYETLDKNNEEVKSALNDVKVNVGKEQYNTRLDILNKIKQDDSEYVSAHEYKPDDFKDGHVVTEEPRKKMSLLEKLAAMSPEEDAEELKRFEEGLTVADLMNDKKKKSKKQSIEEEVQQPTLNQHEDIIDEDEEDNGKLITILNYVIIVFIIIFVVLAFFIVKQLLF